MFHIRDIPLSVAEQHTASEVGKHTASEVGHNDV